MTDILDRLKLALADRYAIEREIGSGGMATVYLAQDLKHHRPVAVKVLRPELAAALGPERFLREIEISARLTHPHILPLHDSGEADGFLFYVMPYVEGESLRDRIRREKQLPIDDALQVAREVGDALSYAHSHDVVHRDIKPENILLEAGHAVVADFGIARAITAAGSDTLTEPGLTVGTPAYMSPEQAAGSKEIDGRSDIYSLGCVLYEMLAGQPPFTGPTVESVVHQHLSTESPSITNIRPTVPDAVAGVLSRALAKTPADRFHPAAQFVEALSTAVTSPPIPAVGARAPSGRWIGALAAVAAVLAIVFAISSPRLFDGGTARGSESAPRDWILVAEFEGSVDAPHLRMARELVRTVLDQSAIIATVPRDQLRRGLSLAGKPDTTLLVQDVARELAVRGSIRSVLTGQIDRAGQTYSVLLRVVDAKDGAVLVAENGLASGDDQLIQTIDIVARALREGLGEQRSVIRANRPLIEVATPSFEAYSKYAEASELHDLRNWDAARQLAREALALDPDFAAAYRLVGLTFFNSGQFDSAKTAFLEARRRPERLTDQERLTFEALSAWIIDGDLTAALRTYDQLLALNPSLPRAQNNRAAILFLFGRYEEALAGYRRAEEVSPFGPPSYNLSNQFGTLLNLRQVDEAENILALLEVETRRSAEVELALAKYDWSEAERLGTAIQQDPATPVHEAVPVATWLASALSARGAVIAADVALSKARDRAMEAGITEDVVSAERSRLLLMLVSGRDAAALSDEGWSDESVEGVILKALWSAATGDTTTSASLLQAVRQSGGSERGLELVEAMIFSAGGQWDSVVSTLAPTAQTGEQIGIPGTHLERWVVARAYEQLNRLDSAAAYLNLIVEPSRIDWQERFRHGIPYSFAHRRLAILNRRLGREADAERHWKIFSEAWRNADPELLPLLEQEQTTVIEADRTP